MPVARMLSILAVMAAAVGLPIAGAGAAPKQGKDFTMEVVSAFAGDTVDYGVTLTNRTGTQQLGSANVKIPAAIGLGTDGGLSVAPRGTAQFSASDPRIVELRGLDLADGQSATLTIEGLEIPCVGVPEWDIPLVKQSNDFSGLPGNGLTLRTVGSDRTTDLVGQCRLDFLAQPKGAQVDESIRSLDFERDGPPVQVGALDANEGDPVPSFDGPVAIGASGAGGGRLSQSPGDPVDGGALLSYFGLSIDAAGTYQLSATKTGYVSATSTPFPIVDVQEPCNGSKCDATLDGSLTSTTVSGALGPGDEGHVLLSLNVGTPPECAGYDPPGEDWYEFLVTAERDKTVLATYSKAAMKVFSGGHSALQICFAAPQSFPAQTGPAAPFDYDGDSGNGAEGFVGLLPNCPATPASPCILDRAPSGGGGAQVLFFVPADWGDPRYH